MPVFEYISPAPPPQNTTLSRVFIEILPFVHYPTGANAFIWSESHPEKQLFFVSEWLKKHLYPLN